MSTCISHKSLPLCFYLVGDHGHETARSFKAVFNKGTNGQRAHLPTDTGERRDKNSLFGPVCPCVPTRESLNNAYEIL